MKSKYVHFQNLLLAVSLVGILISGLDWELKLALGSFFWLSGMLLMDIRGLLWNRDEAAKDLE